MHINHFIYQRHLAGLLHTMMQNMNLAERKTMVYYTLDIVLITPAIVYDNIVLDCVDCVSCFNAAYWQFVYSSVRLTLLPVWIRCCFSGRGEWLHVCI